MDDKFPDADERMHFAECAAEMHYGLALAFRVRIRQKMEAWTKEAKRLDKEYADWSSIYQQLVQELHEILAADQQERFEQQDEIEAKAPKKLAKYVKGLLRE